MTTNHPHMPDAILTDVVDLEQRRNELACQLEDADCKLWTEMVNVAYQLKEGKSVPPAVALVLARNELPDFEDFH